MIKMEIKVNVFVLITAFIMLLITIPPTVSSRKLPRSSSDYVEIRLGKFNAI